MESFLTVLAWATIGIVIHTLPNRRQAELWRFGLTALGIPILGLVTLQHGPFMGLAALVMGVALLYLPSGHDAGPDPEQTESA